MNKIQATPYIGYYLDDSLASHDAKDMPANARLVGWQCGFEPMFVAVWSYLGGKLGKRKSEEIATDYLNEINWFSGEPKEADYIL